jgi:thiamine biosynthesis lipoprotein
MASPASRQIFGVAVPSPRGTGCAARLTAGIATTAPAVFSRVRREILVLMTRLLYEGIERKRRRLQAAAVRCTFAVALLAALPDPSPQLAGHHQASRMSMACLYTIDAYGPDAAALPGIAAAAFDEVDRIDRLMSHYKPDSALSRINRDAAQHPVIVEPELFDFLAEAMRYSRESDGAFDITVGPLMKAWGFFRDDGHVPGDEALAAARARVGASHVRLDPVDRSVRFDVAGVELDLGGIAKGYAVDRAVHVLRDRGVSAALVSAGGSSSYGLGGPPGADAWPVDIQDPRGSSKTTMTVHLRDRALSVAGTSEKFFERDGVRYAHIMDPRTGRPVQGMLSVVVLTSTATAGDALDDAFFVLGVEGSRRLIERLTDTEVFFFKADGSVNRRSVIANR